MSEIFDGDAADPVDERGPSRRARALIITAVILVLAFIALTTFASFYTDRLWYQSVDYSSVFTTLLGTKVLLFVVFSVLMAGVVGANMLLAYRLRPLFGLGSAGESGLDRYRDAVTPIRTWLLVGVSLVLGVFAGTSGAGEWRAFLLWRNGGAFGERDAYFNKDIGFYVFDLPWLHYLLDFVMAATVVALLAAAVVHYLYGGIRLQVTHDRLTGPAQAQLSVLLGVFVLAKAGDYWLDRYDLVLRSGSRFTGMNFTGENAVLPSKNILMGIALICAVLFFLNVWRRTWLLPSMGLALLVLSAILLGLIWPGIVQQFQVNPNPSDREEKYIAKNIDATLTAYDLDDVTYQNYDPSESSTVDLAALLRQTDGAPLVDPKIVSRTFDINQQARGYYTVPPVLDVDRYTFDEEGSTQQRALVLAARELDQTGIDGSDQNWSNLHTVYTHGSGVIAAFANQQDLDQDNSPCEDGACWAQGTDADQDALTEATGTFRRDIYFGENSPNYSIVGKSDDSDPDLERTLSEDTAADPDEADSDEDAETDRTTYTGSGGVGIGSGFRQLMYAIKFGEANFVLSSRVNDNSRVLYERSPRERVEKVAPWLTLDDDAYPAIVDGKIVWILDGYTTTDRYPNAQRESFDQMTDDSLQTNTGLRTLPTDEINYLRNAVKATVDAYDGTVSLYAWDEDDPILKAWEGAFPGTVKPKADIPKGLLDHLRYPEDQFKVQRYQLAQYHVTDARDWFEGNQRWSVPQDPDDQKHLQPPFRLFDNPTGGVAERPVWSLTSSFVPYKKNNLASFVSVNSEATADDYGTFSVLQLPANDNTTGPGQASTLIQGNEELRTQLQPFLVSSSQPLYGNLLTLPVDGNLIYIQPIYVNNEASSSGFPQLRVVAVVYAGRVGSGPTLVAALEDALTTDADDEDPSSDPTTPPESTPPTTTPPSTPGATGTPSTPPTGSTDDQIRSLLRRAQAAFDAADAALQRGDGGEYNVQLARAQDFIAQALELAKQGGTTPSTPTGPTSLPSSLPSSSAEPSP